MGGLTYDNARNSGTERDEAMSITRDGVQEKILRTRELPTLPAVLVRIIDAAADPDSSALELSQLVASDQSISATVLRLVNSPYYGFYRKIESMTQAIVMLGFFEVRNIALMVSAFKKTSTPSAHYDRTQLWRHSLAAAMAAERCARAAHLPVTGCFEAGLLHDIGKVVFDILYPKEFREAAQIAHEQQLRVALMETSTFGMDHAEAGAILGEQWNLPPSVVEAIRFHESQEGLPSTAALGWLTAAANCAAYEAGFGESSNPIAPELPEFPKGSPLNRALVEQIALDVKASEEKIEEFVGALEA